jgi:hypothetical protein
VSNDLEEVAGFFGTIRDVVTGKKALTELASDAVEQATISDDDKKALEKLTGKPKLVAVPNGTGATTAGGGAK